MEPEGLLLHTQVPATCPYPDLTITFYTVLLQVPKDPWNILRTSK
jgi:hypothetical protein